jgi:8-oxo-dGTP pyrophosphatase MutT (NUDIX family)
MMIQPKDIRERGWNPPSLCAHIRKRLAGDASGRWPRTLPRPGKIRDSAVLLPLVQKNGDLSTPCLVLNKRSAKVRQPGDLCFPGGGIGNFDGLLAGLQRLPAAHLSKWPAWNCWRAKADGSHRQLALLFTTSLRESWEEMRLNPFRVSFLGPLPPQHIVMFQRTIHPMVGWIHHQKQFKPNWEVERIITIPLDRFLNARHYGCYRLTTKNEKGYSLRGRDRPCFIFENDQGREILWGASYHITMSFLSLCFDFTPPAFEKLPVIEKYLGPSYFSGQ